MQYDHHCIEDIRLWKGKKIDGRDEQEDDKSGKETTAAQAITHFELGSDRHDPHIVSVRISGAKAYRFCRIGVIVQKH
ncbi:MAG: hypothetical protein DMG68_02345 [Acidobacteria bacterium]|nr:MAG: hypothetical protein DMG68_02345 [Acidobacteriota bacterium]